MPESMYLVTPEKDLPHFTFERDQLYFAHPVKVDLLWTQIDTRHVYVRDPRRGDVYPVSTENLRTEAQLSVEQKEKLEK